MLCVGYRGEMIEQEFGNGRNFGVELSYSFDGPELLGTGGALKKAQLLLGQRFLVLYGDSYLPIDYAAPAQASGHEQFPAMRARPLAHTAIPQRVDITSWRIPICRSAQSTNDNLVS